jgi:hypothetical protein
MWIKNFINECKVWREIRKVYKNNKEDFLKVGLKIDWFGHIYKVINRDVSIPLGTNEDEFLLREELSQVQEVLVKNNVLDILAYELRPLEEDDGETYEHGYLILFTPAYRLDKQYLTVKNVLLLSLLIVGIVTGIVWLFIWAI